MLIPVKNALNKKKILSELYFNGKLSCADLSLKTNKSIPLVTKLLSELVDEGYVTEIGYAQSSGGRKPLMFSLKKDIMYVVSVAMDQFVTRMVLIDMENNFVSQEAKFELNLYENKNS